MLICELWLATHVVMYISDSWLLADKHRVKTEPSDDKRWQTKDARVVVQARMGSRILRIISESRNDMPVSLDRPLGNLLWYVGSFLRVCYRQLTLSVVDNRE